MVIVMPKTIVERKMACNLNQIDYRLYVDAGLENVTSTMNRKRRDKSCSPLKEEKITIPKLSRPKNKKSRQKYNFVTSDD